MTTLAGALTDVFRRWFGAARQNSADDTVTASARTGGDGQDDPVVVWRAANPLEAQVVKGRLVSEGIPAFVRGEALGSIYGLTAGGLASTDVLAPAPLADKALEILHSDMPTEWVEDDIDSSMEDGEHP